MNYGVQLFPEYIAVSPMPTWISWRWVVRLHLIQLTKPVNYQTNCFVNLSRCGPASLFV